MNTGMKKAAVVGCGNMGGAVIDGICRSGLFAPTGVVACDLDEARMSQLGKHYGITAESDLAAACRDASLIVFAVKPQQIDAVLAVVGPVIQPQTILLSVMAGVIGGRITAACSAPVRLVRAMPNMACFVGQGITGLVAGDKEAKDAAVAIFSQMGKVVIFENEDQLDIVTGLSGSGPAFAAAIISGFADGAVKMGLDRERSLVLAEQTMLGTAEMLLRGVETPESLRRKVATPGGTTESGLRVLEQGGITQILISTIEASTLRARELREGKK